MRVDGEVLWIENGVEQLDLAEPVPLLRSDGNVLLVNLVAKELLGHLPEADGLRVIIQLVVEVDLNEVLKESQEMLIHIAHSLHLAYFDYGDVGSREHLGQILVLNLLSDH